MCEYFAYKVNFLGMKNSLMRLNGSTALYLPDYLSWNLNDNRSCEVTLDVQRSEQAPTGYMCYIRFHSFIHKKV